MKIKFLNDYALMPTRGSKYAAGLDLYAAIPDNVDISVSSTKKIGTGIAIEIPHGCFGAIFPRSGMSTRRGLRLANCVAVIDEDYRGEVIVPLYNDSQRIQTILPGDRIAQLVIIPYEPVELEETLFLEPTRRDAGGFGSSGQ